jgi:hypothetical protein
MNIKLAETIADIGQDVARAMVRVSTRDGVARISTPVLFPSGTKIGVEISHHRDGFLVSDMGGAALEADMAGGGRQFGRIAAEVAQRYGVRFDQRMLFDLEVPRNELTVAVVSVANAAKSAVEATIMQVAARETIDLRSILWTRLDRVFGGPQVQHEIKVRGSSDDWTFDAAVQSSRGLTVFEIVNPHANAVASAVTKFLDIRDLGDTAPGRVAVLPVRDRTPHLAVLARTAQIIAQDAGDDAFRAAA